ncbi:MAG TPA: hypothetical protein VOB72_25650 [Candidatus Dormibacteraeota bacterium]|nr:hypothetical protein [Candidatus Dormibacteraeota bacterium]
MCSTSRRVSLYVLGGIGAGIVFEEREDGHRTPVQILSGPEAARRWIESRFDGVDWESPHRATALVGRLANPFRPHAPTAGRRVREHPPVTYETAELRAHLPALVVAEDRVVIVQQCEEHVEERDLWEPFVTVLWEWPPQGDGPRR